MSRNIENDVVVMEFDNKQFEQNIQTSMGTLDKLKQSLSLEGATDGLKNIGETAKNLSLEGVNSAVDTVRVRFSMLEVAAITALSNIVNKAVDAGVQLVKSLTIDPIKQGFDEYQLKMDSIQTIMSSTGADIDEVTGYLNELNEYSDRTIYSFSDMTQNIGKFTNAGVSLNDAVLAIKGISNEAALSGANANEASRAMYNFSQALSAGYVKLIDWKSIENANMATKGFKEELINTAVALGTLVEENGKYISTTTDANGKVSDAFTATTMFNDSLSHQWMTTEVLVETLRKYSDESTDIGKKAYAAAQDVKTWSQLVGTLKESVGSGWAMTFELIFGNLEEAKVLWTGVSTVIGGIIDKTSDARNATLRYWKEELKGRDDLIGGLRNIVQTVRLFSTVIGQAFNKIFPEATAQNFAKVLKLVSEGFKNLTKALIPSSQTLINVRNIFSGIFSVFKLFVNIIKTVITIVVSFVKALSPVGKAASSIGSGFLFLLGTVGSWLTALNDVIEKHKVFETIAGKVSSAIEAVANGIKRFVSGIVWFFTSIKELKLEPPSIELFKKKLLDKLDPIAQKIQNGLKGILEKFTNITKIKLNVNPPDMSEVFSVGFDKIIGFITNVKEKLTALKEFFTEFWDEVATKVGNFTSFGDLVDSFKNKTDSLSSSGGALRTAFATAFAAIGLAFSKLGDALRNGFNSALPIVQSGFAKFGEFLTNGVDAAKNSFGSFKDGILSFKDTLSDAGKDLSAGDFVDSLKEKFGSLSGVGDNIKGVFSTIGDAIKSLWDFINNLGLLNIVRILDGIMLLFIGKNANKFIKTLPKGLQTIIETVLSLKDGITGFFKSIGSIGTGISDVLTSVKDVFVAYQNDIKANILIKVAEAVAILAAALLVISFIDSDKLLDASLAIAAFVGELTASMVILGKMSMGSSNNMKKAASSFIDTAALNSLITNVMKIAGAVLLMSAALKVVSTIDPTRLWETVGVVSVLMAELSGMVLLFSKLAKSDKLGESQANMAAVGFGLIEVSIAIRIIASALKAMEGMDPDSMANGIIAIGASMTFIAIALKNMPSSSAMVGVGFGLIEVSVALLIIGQAIKQVGSLAPEQIVAGLAGIAGAMFSIASAVDIMPSGKDMMGIGLGLIEISAALLIIGQVIKNIGSLKSEVLAKGLSAIAISMTFIASATETMPSGKDMMGIGLGLIEISVALAIMGAAIHSIGQNSWEQIAKGLTVFATALIALGVATKLMPKGVEMVLIGAGIAEAAVSYAILVAAMKAASDLSWEDIGKGLAIFVAALAGLAVAGKLISVALAPLAGLAITLSMFNMSLGTLAAGIALLSASFLALGAAGVAGAVSLLAVLQILIPGIAAIIISSAPVWTLAIETLVLSLLGMFVTLIPSIAEAALEMVKGVLEVLVQYAPEITNLIFDFLVVVMDTLAERIPELADHLPKFIEALKQLFSTIFENVGSENLLEISEAFLILIGITKLASTLNIGLIGQALLGVLQVGAVLAALTGVLAGIGALNKIPGLQEFVDSGGDLLLSVGTAIGNFIGGIVGGVAEGFAAVLPDIATYLSDFMTNIQGFVTGAASIKAESFEGIPSLVAAMIAIAAAEVITAVADFASAFLGSGGIDSFGQDLVKFGGYMKKFSESIDGINNENVTTAANAGLMLSSMASNLPKEGGWLKTIIGETKDLDTFGEELVSFGPHLKAYADSIAGISADDVETSTAAAQMLANMASTLPKEDGLLQKIIGETKDLDEFGEELVSFGPHLKAYADSIAGISGDDIEASAKAAQMLSDMANTLPKEDGVWQKLAGTVKDLDDFGDELEKFGPSLKAYADSVDGIDEGKVTVSKNAAQMMSDLASTLPTEDGLKQKIFGSTKNLSDFGDELKKFGPKLKAFATSVDGIDESKVTTAKNAASMMSELAKNLPENETLYGKIFGSTKNLPDFGEELVYFGAYMKAYGKQLVDIDETKVATSKRAATMMSDLAKNLPENSSLYEKIFGGGTKSLSEFGEELVLFGAYLKVYNTKITDIDETKVATSKRAATMMSDLAKNLPESGGTLTEWFGGQMSLDTFGKALEEFGMSLVGYSAAIGTIDNIADMNTAIYQVQRLIDLSNDMSTMDSTAFGTFATSLKSLGEAGITEFISAFDTAATDAETAIDTFLTSVDDHLSTWSDTLETTSSSVGEDIVSGLSTGISDNVDSVLITEIDDMIDFITETLDDSITEENYKIYGTNMLQYIASGINSSESRFMNVVEKLCQNIIKKFREKIADKDFKTVGERIVTSLSSGITSKQETLIKTVTTLCTNVVSIANSIIKENDFINLGSNGIVRALIRGLSNTGNLYSVVTDVCNNVKRTFQSGLDLYMIGVYAVIGLSNGIRDGKYNVTNVVNRVCGDIVQAVKNMFKIQSPSKVFEEIGEFLILGLANGITSLEGLVVNTVEDLSESAINSMSNSIAGIVSAINSELDADPVIRPVLDLSEIQNGVGSIDSMFSSGIFANGITIGTSLNAIRDITGRMSESNAVNVSNEQPVAQAAPTYNFTQNNYSPKALSRKEIYRQTRNQFSVMKGL